MTDEQERWLAVIGKSLAFIAYQQNDAMRDADVPTKAKFLAGLGLTPEDMASVLGATENKTEGAMAKALQRAQKGAKGKGRRGRGK